MAFARLAERGLDAAESLLHSSREKAVIGKHAFLSGYFRPVDAETAPTELGCAEGTVPPFLDGAFVRIGPSVALPPAGQYHLFDGDGLLASVRFRPGQAAVFATHRVRTARLEAERAAGRATFLKLGDMHGLTGVLLLALLALREKLVGKPPHEGAGTANTALAFHAGRLLALHEGDMPYALRVLCEGAVETLGRAGALHPGLRTFTAHPKLDASTGELLYFSYDLEAAGAAKQPHLTYGVLDAAGVKVHSTSVPLRHAQMSHDFAVTQRFALFWDTPLKFDPAAMVRADSLPFVFDASLGTRFGVVPRRGDGSADARWFSLPSCMIFHSLGAWEEGEGGGGAVVKLLACRMERFTLALPPRGGGGPGGAQQPPPDPRSAAAAADGGSPTLYEFTFDLRSGAAAQRCVLPLPAGVTGMDFPRAHPALVGRPLRFGYLAAFQGLAVCAAVKVDVTTGAVAARADYPADACGGEPCFVPRRPGDPGLGEAEDDGWVLTFVTTNAATSLWVMGAKALDVEAVLPLPSRLPFGFHSAFITRAEMDAQRGDLPA